jgi:hypothetical protein
MSLRNVTEFLSRVCFVAFFVLASTAGWAAEADGGLVARPFAARSHAPGATMFTELAPAETGIVTENHYADPEMWGRLSREFEIGALGTGVAIGDYDGDGRPDLFVVSKTESCRLFRNLGGWKFEDVTERAGVMDSAAAAKIWKQGATFVDVNNDGRLDIYVCRFNAPNLLYINEGDGTESGRGGVTFKEMAHAYGLDVRDASVMAAFCDYDRDGWLDLYLATNILDSAAHPKGQRGYLFHNDGNRAGSGGTGVTFSNVTDRLGGVEESQSHSATWWDYDNDGWPDLYVANDFAPPDKLYRNNRDGTFTNVINQVVPHTTFSSMGSDLGDVNNDGLIDLVVAEMAATTHEKDQRGMVNPRSQAVEPRDGVLEAQQRYFNTLLLNTGTGRCLEAAFLAGVAATDWTWSPRFEDLDQDGRIDLFVTNGMHREATNADLLRRLMSAETANARLRVMRDSPVMAEANMAFRNLGDLRFESVGAVWGLDQVGVSFGTALGDLDGDGDLDMVYGNYQKGVTVLRNDGTKGHGVIVALRGSVSNRFGVGATVKVESALGTQVRQLVLARGNMSSSEPALHFGLGGDSVIKRMTVTWPSGHVQTYRELSPDVHYTITEPLEPGPGTQEHSIHSDVQFEEVSQAMGLALRSREEPVDENAQQRLLPMRLNRRGPALAVDDSANGGPARIAVGGTTLSAARILRQAAPNQFTALDTGTVLPGDTINDGPLLWLDADGDGRNDLLVTKGGNSLPAGAPEYQPKLFLDDGNGTLRAAPKDALPALSISAGAVTAADFDRDGHLDVFIGARVLSGQYPLAPSSALLANRGGKFEEVTDALAPGLREVGMVTSALWSDVDGDGWPDLLIALEWGNVKCFHNQQGRGLEDWTEKLGFAVAGTGWWTSLASADFNGDGRADYVAGNVGLNTQYRADASHPALLFYGDFRGDGEQPELVEAYYEGDRLFPWRSRNDLGAAIPQIRRGFPSNNDYARATLAELLGEDKLAAAQRFAATELRSGVFLSQPDGTYCFEPLPRIAQIAPLQGLVAGDFDGDGYADIYAVQNMFAPIPVVGRFDGGLSQFLRGDGRGHFTPVPPAESGLVVPGDAKALAVLDLDRDGWPDFLISRNNDTALAFRNRSATNRHMLRVLLHGPAGNPKGIGARVTLEHADGSIQTSEVGAGAGDYSQSTAGCFFGWPTANPPRKVRVCWPLGQETEHDVPPATPTLLLNAPSA